MYPDHAPEINNGDWKFYGWNCAEGDYLPGVDRSATIICGVQQTPNICGNDAGPIICKEDDVDYTVPIKAYLVEHKVKKFNVVFKYMGSDGQPTSHTEEVAQNTHIPRFHIHNSYEKDGSKFTFRHWLLESGNLTSSLTVLSNLVFVAIYDETKDTGTSDTTNDPQGQGEVQDGVTQTNPQTFTSCTHCKGYLSVDGHTHDCYCDLVGLDPRAYNDHFEELGDCLYVRILRELYGEDKPTPKARKDSQGNVLPDLKQTTMIEIEDIANLIKALFKVNIDIAHREYFLKIDVPEPSNWWYGYQDGDKWISFEPCVELKFSNLHSDNQLNEEGDLVCTVSNNVTKYPRKWNITPVNRELSYDSGKNQCVQYNDFYYFHDFNKAWQATYKRDIQEDPSGRLVELTNIPDKLAHDAQNFYVVSPLCLYENTQLQSPVDQNDFIKHRLNEITRSDKQVRTFTSFVKKYRPVIMPEVKDIFNDNHAYSPTKYDADVDNNYGVFGWCTIPSKTMVNMEYNEGALYVPSLYDHHNRVSGSNFLQMDNDFKTVYRTMVCYDSGNKLEDNAKNTWVWLYNTRDWTYFTKPFFDVGRNNEVYSTQLDDYSGDQTLWPENSNHINGVIFEKSATGRSDDLTFLQIAQSCQFLARYHHNENNLKTLAEKYTNLLDYATLKKLTSKTDDTFNDVYGSQYDSLPTDFRFPFSDWVDDYSKTSSFVGLTKEKYDPKTPPVATGIKYPYNLGQQHAIDDFDEDSVWFYITMVSPLEQLDSVIELEDIMPYVFWWENRGTENNGPDVDCYGLASSSKLNYEQGGWCYSLAHEGLLDDVWVDQRLTPQERHNPRIGAEHRWHAVSNTLGVDFSKKDNGGTLLASDNSGNVYKGAFDPYCSGTDEKWKVHHLSNAFGANQHEDPTADKYYLPYKAHGDVQFSTKVTPTTLNDYILDSIKNRPMTWNLWNVVRHYVYLKYFKNRHKALGTDAAAWSEVEKYTKKLVKGIYRTFKQYKIDDHGKRATFSAIDDTSTNYGSVCQVHWTNSFIEASTILERNAREHNASLVLFTGNIPRPNDDSNEVDAERTRIHNKYRDKYGMDVAISREMAQASLSYNAIMKSHDSFRVTTNEGVDADDSEDGMRLRKLPVGTSNPYDADWIEDKGEERDVPMFRGMKAASFGGEEVRIFQGFKYGDLPTTYVIGDGEAYAQRQQDTAIDFKDIVDLDKLYPESEYYINDTTRKWVRKIRRTVLNRQILPVYTSMEGMTKGHHELTMEDMKSITFQIVPAFYWKYEWSYNEFMIHRVGKLASPSKDIVMYDMLGNVWEWVRDDWCANIKDGIA